MDEQIRNLLKKYLDDRCSEEELTTIQEILRSGQYAEEWDAVLREDAERIMNENIREELNEERKDQLLDRILQSTKMNIHPFQRAKASIGLFPEWLKIAASVLILLTGGLALMIAFWSSSDGHFVATTAAGEQTEVFLKDGTRVLLNNQSTLRYPDEFDDEVREVYLQGDAFFEVASNPLQPFLLHSGGVTVEVLGTSFNVRAYEDDRTITVTLATGSVLVTTGSNKAGESQSLVPGDQWVYNKTTGEPRLQKVSDEDIRALQEGLLVFQNQPLEEITRALERRYDIRFKFERESLKEQRLTFKSDNSNLDEVLKVLSLASGMEYIMLNDGKVHIKQ